MLNPATEAFQNELNAESAGLAGPVPPTYLEEPRGMMQGVSGILVRPRNTDEVSLVLRMCSEARVAVVPYGGGTGLVGGQVMAKGAAPVILSLERMKALRHIDPVGNTITVEAGMTLAEVQAAAEDAGRMFPLSLASEGSCRIGGNLATNAGGVQVLRYGNTRDLCLGVEAVLPDGTIHHGLKRLRKDNTGYDLRNLLIGSEGSLGVITAAVLKLVAKPVELATCFAVVPDPKSAAQLLARMQDRLDGLVSAFELVHGTGFDLLSETMPDIRLPFAERSEWMVLAECGGGAGSGVDSRLMEVLEQAVEDGLVEDVVLAQSAAQRDAFWTVRETIPEANKRVGAISSHDISIPIDTLPAFIADGQEALKQFGPVRLNSFGHLGDGNLHYNVFPPKGEKKADWAHLKPDVMRVIHDLVHAYDGSISAEHGIGRLKAADLQRYGDPAKLAVMRGIKLAIDPRGIMNPGAVINS
ncbi:MAG: FAD-binding oxidoreductase [Rhodobacteraceae bacterium]|nr:FAD-binding oxidoreductase [Paracoccaceae bacterium]